MTALRKSRANDGSYTPPPEAFDYDAEVTDQGVRLMQERARRMRDDEELEVIEGYVGRRK
jgi:hypothetical protein